MEAVKDFCLNSLPSNMQELRNKLAALKAVVEETVPTVHVQCVNVIFKFRDVMAMYSDSKLNHQMKGIVERLLLLHRKEAVQALTKVLSGFVFRFKNISGSESQAKMALNLLKWVCLLLTYTPITIAIVEMLCTFISAIPNLPEIMRLRDICRHSIRHLFTSKPDLVQSCVDLMLVESAFTPLYLVLLDIIVVHFDVSDKKYLVVVKCFCEAVLGSRVMPDYLILENSPGLFKMVTHQIFKDFLLPAMLKALLRNPDELIRAVCLVISSVPIDLSQYAEVIMEKAIPHLSSQNSATRHACRELVCALAKQCSDGSCVSIIISSLSTALKSAPTTRLTVAEHRQSVLTAVEVMTSCPLSSSGQHEVATQATKVLVAHIKQEVHAATLLAAINVLRTWCLLLPPGSRETLDFIKTCLSSKTTPPLVRAVYLQCVLAMCKEEVDSTLLPLPLQSLERAASATSLQPPVLEEAVVAIHVAVKLSFPDPIPPLVWSLGESHSKQLVSNKLLTAASQDTLVALVDVARVLLCADNSKLKEASQKEWLGGVVRVLLQSPWATRQLAAKGLAAIVELRPLLAEWLLEELVGVTEGEFPAKPLLLALISLATPTHPKKNTVALKSLLITHHPSIVEANPAAWELLLKKLELQPSSLVASSSAELVTLLTSNMATKPAACLHALRSLLTQQGDAVSALVVEELCKQLSDHRVLEATDQDMEILHTPEGEIWHAGMKKELTAGVMGGTVSTANMKKTSKVYSYEDQKWDLEVQQELLRKKSAEFAEAGRFNVRELLKKAKLSQKQKQSIETQLADEEATRACLSKLSQQLGHMVALLEVMHGDHMLPHVPRLSHVTRAALTSPLARGHCQNIWTILSHSVFTEWTLAQLFVETSICTLTSKTPPPLTKVFTLLKDYTSKCNSASHTLSLSLLEYVLASHDTKLVPHDLRDCAVKVLSCAVDKYASTVENDSTPLSHDQQLFPAHDTLRLISAVLALEDESLKMAKIKKSCSAMFVSLLSSVLCQQPQVITIVTAALLHQNPLLRGTALHALTAICPPYAPHDPNLLVGMLVAQNCEDETDRKLATNLCDAVAFTDSMISELSNVLIQQCSSGNLMTQLPTALALGAWLEKHSDQVGQALDSLLTTYGVKRAAPPPKKDSFGRDIFIDFRDQWECRVGVAKALEQLSKCADSAKAMRFLKFVIPEALADPSSEVRSAMMAAAQATIGCHGDSLAGELMAHSEESLKSIPDSAEADTVRQAIIVLMGVLAKHLDKDNPKVKAVVHLLLGNLDTPSQQVQEAIARCLPPLASVVKPDAETIIKKLLDKLLESTSFSQRKGAAYGLAGLTKGLGIPTLKQFHVMTTLQEAIKNKKNHRHREGALFAFQSLCDMLGRLFEPYVVHLLPDLLVCFGDGNQYVRDATDQTARTVMTHLSSHGVKLILPSLLTALEEDSWRTKAGSAELLGAMAFCAPKQLSSCLPGIVPRLMDVLADSHSKVQAAGSQALKQIGSVIKNPEIQKLVPVLLEALSDPSNKAQLCLQALLETEFVHVIDPPSLALIMPTLKRTLEVRSTDTKKMAAQIIGNMYSLTDKKDLAPYLPDVLPGLKLSLVDPVPEVRTVCAKALGAIARGMGHEGLTELLPWLQSALKSDGTSVDRSGAAQGISEVLFSQGVGYLEKLLPQFIAAAQDVASPSHIRDGYLMLFVYLPVTFGEQMCGFIGDILPAILKGLADECEFVRETSLHAGQTVVDKYADTAVELFLPQLEQGLFDENWRIRCSSIQLLGDLLFKISGLSGKMSTESEEDDNFGTEAAHKMLLKGLGKERRDRVFAGLYMGRSDVALLVRQTSLHVWKVVVTNTARTLRDILPTLVHLLLGCLASQSADKRKVAARTLGDLVRKLGERVLPEVIPMLKEGLSSEATQERQGVCIGLSEIIQQTSRDNILLYMDSILPTVQSALCDQQNDVRAAAALTFDSLHSTVGPRVLDEVLSPLLLDLSSPSSDRSEVALDGLRQVMAVKSRVVLPHIIPQLIRPPVNIRALALLTSVAGESLNKHLNRIIPALVTALEGSRDQEVWQSAEKVVLSVQKEPGPAFLIEELVKCCRAPRPEERLASMRLLQVLCSKSAADLSEHTPFLMIFTTESLNDPSDDVCEEAWLGLEATVKRIKQKELPHYTGYLRKGLRTVSANLSGSELRGFGIKGITPALTLLKEGLINGSPDEKEEAAHVLVEVIHLASPQTLSGGKVVMLIAGPLIRVLGDRYGWNVKVATLKALVELVRKVGVAAKAFIPQLQTSYLKALNDTNKPVRVQAVTGLTELLPLSPRVDPVFNDLHNGVKKSEDPGLRWTMLQALHGVIKAGGQRMSEKHRDEILATLITLQGTAHEGHRLEAAQCVGSLCVYLSDTQLHGTLATHVLDQDGISDWAVLQARATTISSALLVASSRIVALGLRDVVVSCVVSMAKSDRVPVCVSGLQGIASFLNHVEGEGREMLPSLCQGLGHSSLDVKVPACDVCAELVSPSDPILTSILPPLVLNSKEKNTAVKAAAEQAIYKLLQGQAHLKYICGLLDTVTARKLEDVYTKVQAKH